MEQVRPKPAERRRRSIFTEVGLVDEDRIREERSPAPTAATCQHVRPARKVRFRSRNSICDEREESDGSEWESALDDDDVQDPLVTAPMIRSTQQTLSTKLSRIALFAFVLAIMLPIFSINPMTRFGVRAGAVPLNAFDALPEHAMVVKRDDSPTEACKRWAGQSTIVNGTLYMYGFRTVTDSKQQDKTWSKNRTSLGKKTC